MIHPSKIALFPFMLCVKLLEFLGRRFNLTYKEISVVVNLWVQGFLLMVSGILPFAKGIIVGQPVLSIVCWGLYVFIYVVGFVWMLWHYRLPFERAFDLCVEDYYGFQKDVGYPIMPSILSFSWGYFFSFLRLMFYCI